MSLHGPSLRRPAVLTSFANFIVTMTVLMSVLTDPQHRQVTGYSADTPDTVCATTLPVNSGATAQSDAAPYTLTVSSMSYTAGQSLFVTLAASEGTDFEGYLLEARRQSTNTVVGTFSNLPSNSKLACSGAGVTHTTNNKQTSVTVTWTAPTTSGQGSVVFVATVVSSSTFWTNVRSRALTEVDAGTVRLIPPSSQTWVLYGFQDVNTTACDVSLACFRLPSGCDAPNCDYVLSWSDAGDAIQFEMSATVASPGYLAFGLSKDTKMGSDSVISCVAVDQANVGVEVSWNEGENNIVNPDLLGIVPNTSYAAFSNGRIMCGFSRLKQVGAFKKHRSVRQTIGQVYPLDTDSYYILFAKGPTSAGMKQQHVDTAKSSSTVNFTAFTSVGASNSSLGKNLLKAHGILMMFAWMVFASFGMLMPRYFKPAWPKTTWFGKNIWFQVHQAVMILALLLTAAGFIIVFVKSGEYSELPSPTVAHPPLGIVVMALVIINPIMAIFRPEPNAKNRPIFNILHFLVGLLAHLCAVVTLFLGMYMTAFNLPVWCKGVMAGYICFHALIEVVLAGHMHYIKGSSGKVSTKELQMTSSGEPDAHSQPQASGSKFKTTIVVIHLIGVLGCCIAISVQVGIS